MFERNRNGFTQYLGNLIHKFAIRKKIGHLGFDNYHKNAVFEHVHVLKLWHMWCTWANIKKQISSITSQILLIQQKLILKFQSFKSFSFFFSKNVLSVVSVKLCLVTFNIIINYFQKMSLKFIRSLSEDMNIYFNDFDFFQLFDFFYLYLQQKH